jgi:hypothetical protein
MLSIALAALFAGLVIYEFGDQIVPGQQADTETSMAVLEKLRHSPSLEQGLTVEQRMMKEVDTSRRVGNLHSYKGWAVTAMSGDRFLIAFSYREVDETEHRAEWIADKSAGTYTPQTELAAKVFEAKQ